MHFVIDAIQADSAPLISQLLLIECIMRGIQVPDNLVIFGGMDGAGKINYKIDSKRSPGTLGEAIKLTAQAAQARVWILMRESQNPIFHPKCAW